MPFQHFRHFTLSFLLGMALPCGFVLGVDLNDSHGQSPSTTSSVANAAVFQPRKIMPSSSITVYYDDDTLSHGLVELRSERDHPQALTRTESIQLPRTASPTIPPSHFPRRINFQRTPESVPHAADLYFDLARMQLGTDLIDVLQSGVDALAHDGKRFLSLQAFCDQRGGVAYSLALAAGRTGVVRHYLLDLGVLPHEVQAINYGSFRPACRELSERCHEGNQRIQATFEFFAILEPQFGCLTRLKLAGASRIIEGTKRDSPPLVHRQIRLAPLLGAK